MAFGFVPGIISVGSQLPPTPGSPGGYIREITLNSNTFSSADLYDYPTCIRITNASFSGVDNGGNVLSPDANDILFYADSTLTTLLNWDLVYWDSTSGQIVAWVKIPLLSHTTTTTFYINYGNTSLNLNLYYGNRKNVWVNNYKSVIHFGTNKNFYDSVNNVNLPHYGLDFLQTNIADLPYALKFGNSDINWIDTQYKPDESFSYSFFFNYENATNMALMGNYDAGKQTGTGIAITSSKKLMSLNDNKVEIDTNVYDTQTDYFVTITYDHNTQQVKQYIDAYYFKLITGATVNATDNFLIGKFQYGFGNYIGLLSNYKMTNTVRNIDDIRTEWASITQFGKYTQIGSEILYNGSIIKYFELTYALPASAINYPLYINLTSSELRHLTHGGYVANLNGYDIMFFADSDFTQPLQYEIESYDGLSGWIVAHVKIPELIYQNTYNFYMVFGFTNITEKPNIPILTWNENYQAVYNFANQHDGTVTTTDSTSNVYDLTPSIGTASNYLNDDKSLFIDEAYSIETAVLNVTDGLTVYGWYYINDITAPYQSLFYVGDMFSNNQQSNDYGFGLIINANNDGDGTLYFTADGTHYTTNWQIPQNYFTPLFLVVDNGIASIYGGGVNLLSTITNFNISNPSNFTTIGVSYYNNQQYLLNGSINRLRFVNRVMSNIELGNDWLAVNITKGTLTSSTGLIGGYSFYFDPGNPNSYNDPNTNLTDLSLYGSTGFTVNNPTYSQDGGGSLGFDETNYGYFQDDSKDNFNLSGVDGYTIESWVKFDTFTSYKSNGQIPFSKGVYTANYDWAIRIVNNVTLEVGTQGTGKLYTITLNTPLQTNTWYHIACSGDNLMDSRLYINGVLVGQYDGQNYFQISNSAGNIIEIGGYGWDSGGINNSENYGDPVTYGKLLGKLGVCRLYKRKLGETDIAANYNFEKTRYGY